MSLPFFADDTSGWDLCVAKALIYPDKVADVQERLAQLQSSEPSSSFITYCGAADAVVELTPRFLRVRADEACAEALVGPRTAWTTLPSAGMTEASARVVLRSVLHAVFALHSRHIIHGYLSRLTVMTDRATQQRALLIAHVLPVQLYVLRGSLGQAVRAWAAPEIRRNEPYGPAADVWGIAVLLLQLTRGIPTNSSSNSEEVSASQGKELDTDDIVDADLFAPFLHPFSSCAQSLLVQCLRSDPARRPTLAELLMHPFFFTSDECTTQTVKEGEEAEGGGEEVTAQDGSASESASEATETSSEARDDETNSEDGERSVSRTRSSSIGSTERTTSVVLTRE